MQISKIILILTTVLLTLSGCTKPKEADVIKSGHVVNDRIYKVVDADGWCYAALDSPTYMGYISTSITRVPCTH